jgi:lysophospholipase L1-like esterase
VDEMNPRGEGDKPEDVAPLSVYVDIIKEVARYYSLPVCDLYANSGLQPNVSVIKEKYIPDGLHPNDKGNEIIAEKLGEFLKSI